MTAPTTRFADVRHALLLAVCCFAIYNANGREIASSDSQPTKFAARELLLRGTLSLNHVVGAVPQLAGRSGFVMARDGRYRSAYSPLPAIAAAAIVWPLWMTGLVDIRAPLAPGLIAALSASGLAASTAGLVFLMACRTLPARRAMIVGAGFALGTGMWDTVSQTLWQHETAIFGLTLAVLAFTRDAIRPRDALAIGAGLALAGASRMQLAPVIVLLLAGTFVRAGWRSAAMSAIIVCTAAIAMIRVNLLWFGSPLGAAPMLEALHVTVHGTSGSFGDLTGLAGVLVSPSRGLLIFSPVVLLAAAGGGAAIRGGWRRPPAWCLLAAAFQYVLYGMYAVWWGGHTYGPRYMLDLLPLLAPVAIAGAERLARPRAYAAAGVALAWSIGVAATGAFYYPNDRWNTDPADVDRYHDRLWEWSDSQIVRCWTRGPSPQNFRLFTREAFRVEP